MTANYWSARRPFGSEVVAIFLSRLQEEEEKLPSSEAKPLKRPSRRTLERWIRVAGNFEPARARGEAVAVRNSPFRGVNGAVSGAPVRARGG